MRLGVGDKLLAEACVNDHADDVPHGPAGHEHRLLLAHAVGCDLFQALDCGVVSKDVIAQRPRRHGAAHLGCRRGDGVGAQVDHAHTTTLSAP